MVGYLHPVNKDVSSITLDEGEQLTHQVSIAFKFASYSSHRHFPFRFLFLSLFSLEYFFKPSVEHFSFRQGNISSPQNTLSESKLKHYYMIVKRFKYIEHVLVPFTVL